MNKNYLNFCAKVFFSPDTVLLQFEELFGAFLCCLSSNLSLFLSSSFSVYELYSWKKTWHTMLLKMLCTWLRSQEMDPTTFQIASLLPLHTVTKSYFWYDFFYLGLSWKKLNWNYIAFSTTIQVTENVWIFAPKMFQHILNKKTNVASVCSPP